MNQYAYRINDQCSKPRIGGTVSANSMEDAVNVLMKRQNIHVVTEIRYCQEHNEFYIGDEKVSILIYAAPELHKKGVQDV